jgi:hypothetical protein
VERCVPMDGAHAPRFLGRNPRTKLVDSGKRWSDALRRRQDRAVLRRRRVRGLQILQKCFGHFPCHLRAR